MLKVLHFADLHLGVENYGKLNTKTGFNTRVEDFLTALDLLVETGLKEKVDLVVFAGDTFRDRNPNPTLQREFAKRISKFITAEIPVVLLVGNHDLPRVRTRANTLEIYKVLNIPDVHVLDKAEIIQVKTGKGYIQVAGIPWDYFLNLFSALKAEEKSERDNENKDNNRKEKNSRDEDPLTLSPLAKSLGMTNKRNNLTKQLEKQIEAKVDDLASKLDPKTPNILAAHLPLGVQFGSEQELEIELDVFLKKDVIENNKFDYIALGHIHRFQKLSENPLTVYPGSLEKVDFGEKDQEKGFVIADLPQKKDKEGLSKFSKQTTSKFYQTSQRRFLELKYLLSDFKKPTDLIKELESQKTKLNGAIVKLSLEGSKIEFDKLDYSKLAEILNITHYHTINKKLIDRKKSRSDLTVEMTPLNALEEYLKLTKTSQKKIEELKEIAKKIILNSE